MLQVHRTDDLSGLLADQATWDALAGNVPFRQSAWLGPWWEHFHADQEGYALVARQGDQIRAILPLFRTRSLGLIAGPRGRVLTMLGNGSACSDYLSILAKPADQIQAATALAKFLVDHRSDSSDGWDAIDIDGVAQTDHAMVTFAKELRQGGAKIHAVSEMSAWHKHRDPTWEDHLKQLGKTQRRKVRRWSEKVDDKSGLEKRIATSIDEVQEALDGLIQMHQRRWNADGKEGSYSESNFREFIHDSAGRFFADGKLHLPSIRKGGRMISAEMHFRSTDDELYCYSSGFELEEASLEPGRILLVQTLMDIYRNDWAGIDFLRGDEPYKKRFGAKPLPIIRLRVFAPGVTGAICYRSWKSKFDCKQWLRARLGRTPTAAVQLDAIALP